ncbi:MAG: hypothetical protein JOZ75_08990 [Candidatus Dormibacteraeota bacterium]|nr:hypothetical protein [Candidatus Dormibacteraeota bacterium]
MVKENWKPDPDEHDFPAAADYLSLVLDQGAADAAVTALRSAPLTHRKAKDLLRASGLPLLPPDNVHVKKDLAKVDKGLLLSPVLLIRGSLDGGWPLQVADGYHRICASNELNEDADIPCRITEHQGT